jgi:hypothetical protein
MVYIYKTWVNEAYHYDINSLYSKGMSNCMPGKYLGTLNPNNVDLKKFWGFLEVEISCDHSRERAFLPMELTNKGYSRLVAPTGTFTGLYFCEEIKLAINNGYKLLNIINAYQFTKIYNLFNDYVKEIYNLKVNSKGPERQIYKLLLNGLYGYLGRKRDLRVSHILNKNQAN